MEYIWGLLLFICGFVAATVLFYAILGKSFVYYECCLDEVMARVRDLSQKGFKK